MTFDDFKRTVKRGFETGELKTEPEVELTELDLAIQYAIGREKTQRQDEELFLTTEDIAGLILKYCGKEVYDRVLSEGEG